MSCRWSLLDCRDIKDAWLLQGQKITITFCCPSSFMDSFLAFYGCAAAVLLKCFSFDSTFGSCGVTLQIRASYCVFKIKGLSTVAAL